MLRDELQNSLRGLLLVCQMAIASESSVESSGKITPKKNALWNSGGLLVGKGLPYPLR